MAVYTEVPDNELRAFVEQYEIGEVMACKGIAEGVENSNYLLHTTQGSYILTLYEKRVKREDLPFFLGLMQHLASKGLTCPTPLNGRDGQALRELCGRPAAICTFLEGMWPRRPNERHCQLLGAALADLHVKGRDFAMQRPNNLSLAGWQELAHKTAARADEVEAGLAKLIAPRSDLLLVIGAPNSSNSQRLVEVARGARCPSAYLVQRAAEIDWRWFEGVRTVGITAGASAPEVLVQEVIGEIRQRNLTRIEEISVTEETTHFKLPRALTA